MFDLKEAEAYEKGEDKALASALALGSPIMLQRKCLHMEESRKYGAAYLPLERDVSLWLHGGVFSVVLLLTDNSQSSLKNQNKQVRFNWDSEIALPIKEEPLWV